MNANEPSTSCCVCCKEIPLDAAFTPEGAEYVEHFCGLECYQRFRWRGPALRPKPASNRTLVIRRRQVEAYPNLMSDAMCKLRQDRIEF